MAAKSRAPAALVEGLESRVLRHAGGVGDGLRGEYFNNKDFTSPMFARTDATVNFTWGTGSPAASIAPETFSVRWTGKIVPHKSEAYTFYTSSDDGVRLWIDGKLVIDKFVLQATKEHASVPIALTAGVPVDVRLDYFENTGGATAKLLWSSATTAKSIIPQDHLLTPEAPPPPLPPPPPPPPSAPAVRIDAAGSSSYTTADGKVWSKDTYYVGGMLSLGGFPIAGTTDDTFYATRRFGKSFSYAIPVAPGDYEVKLYFADASYDAGGRVFNVAAEGQVVLRNYDIVAKVGKGVATHETFVARVADGNLSLAFTGILNNATLSAIEVTPRAVSPTGVTWKSVAPSPVKRAEASGAVVDGKLYALGGWISGADGAIIAQTRCDVYEPATNQWTRLRDMPEAITHIGAAVDGTDIWLVGNFLGNHPGPATAHVWRYDTLTDTWHAGPDLPEKRGAGAAAIVGRRLHFFGGLDETREVESGDHWSLDLDDPAATWVARAAMPNPRNHLGGVALNGKIYAVGGQHGQHEDQVAQAQVDCYDPATDTWTTVAPLPEVRSHIVGCTFVMNGKIIVLGGEVAYQTQRSTVYAYDPVTNAWSLLGTLPAPRSSVVSGALDAKNFIMSTGNAPDATTASWIGTISA